MVGEGVKCHELAVDYFSESSDPPSKESLATFVQRVRAEAKREERERIAKMVRKREAEQERRVESAWTPSAAEAHRERAFALGVLAEYLEAELKEASDG